MCAIMPEINEQKLLRTVQHIERGILKHKSSFWVDKIPWAGNPIGCVHPSFIQKLGKVLQEKGISCWMESPAGEKDYTPCVDYHKMQPTWILWAYSNAYVDAIA